MTRVNSIPLPVRPLYESESVTILAADLLRLKHLRQMSPSLSHLYLQYFLQQTTNLDLAVLV